MQRITIRHAILLMHITMSVIVLILPHFRNLHNAYVNNTRMIRIISVHFTESPETRSRFHFHQKFSGCHNSDTILPLFYEKLYHSLRNTVYGISGATYSDKFVDAILISVIQKHIKLLIISESIH